MNKRKAKPRTITGKIMSVFNPTYVGMRSIGSFGHGQTAPTYEVIYLGDNIIEVQVDYSELCDEVWVYNIYDKTAEKCATSDLHFTGNISNIIDIIQSEIANQIINLGKKTDDSILEFDENGKRKS